MTLFVLHLFGVKLRKISIRMVAVSIKIQTLDRTKRTTTTSVGSAFPATVEDIKRSGPSSTVIVKERYRAFKLCG
jgi:hypothetical protein